MTKEMLITELRYGESERGAYSLLMGQAAAEIERLREAHEKIKRRYIDAVGKGEWATGALVVEMANIAAEAVGAGLPPAAEPTDGYRDAFYKIAELLDIPAMPVSPKEAFETVMLPKLRRLLAEPASREVRMECLYCPARFMTAWELEVHEKEHALKSGACGET